MTALLQGAIHTNIAIFAAVFIANLPTGAIRALATFIAKSVATFCAFIAVLTIRSAVDPLLTDGTDVTGRYRQRVCQNQNRQNSKYRQHA